MLTKDSMENILKLEDVYKTYDKHVAVNKVSFEMPRGSIFGLLGPNGAGKTSLIRIITTITRADQGAVYFNGKILNSSHPSEIGYMPEERGLYKKMKVGDHLMYLARLKGLSHSEAKSAINHWFDKFDIQAWWPKKVEELSKGMQQKIQFISTIIHEPKLLILDEPFSGLDPINTKLIKDEIYNLHESGTSIIFSTHRMEQVEEICQHILLINNGQNILEGKMVDVKNQFKENLYEIVHENEITESFKSQLNIREERNKKLVVKLNEGQSSNELLLYFIKNGIPVISFKEILPTLNEIFIRQVNKTNHG